MIIPIIVAIVSNDINNIIAEALKTLVYTEKNLCNDENEFRRYLKSISDSNSTSEWKNLLADLHSICHIEVNDIVSNFDFIKDIVKVIAAAEWNSFYED